MADLKKMLIQQQQARKQQICLLIAQFLQEEGLPDVAALLMGKTGLSLCSPAYCQFMKAFAGCRWDECWQVVGSMRFAEQEGLWLARKKLLLCKYYAFLDAGCAADALELLRSQHFRLGIGFAEDEVAQAKSLTKALLLERQAAAVIASLQQQIVASLAAQERLPEQRLTVLLQQAVSWQTACCYFAHAQEELLAISLLQNHCCSKSLLPTTKQQQQQLGTGHEDEIWALAFSPNGRYLLSGSKDKTIILWCTESGRILFRYFGHSEGIVYFAWAADSFWFASGSADGSVRVWCTEVSATRL